MMKCLLLRGESNSVWTAFFSKALVSSAAEAQC
jgi:hypothetical protein